MKKVLFVVVASGLLILVLIAAAGFVKFTILQDDIYVELADGTVVSYSEVESMKESETNKDLIVIAAPSIMNEYYADAFEDIIEFDIAYVNAVYGKDEIRILVDDDTREHFTGRVPEEILVEANVEDIWMRDFTTVNPHQPVQFRYTAASLEGIQDEADFIQDSFNSFIKRLGFSFPSTDYFIDGGNIVDNYAGRIITTQRFLEDNDLTKEAGIAELKELLNATEVAIIPADDPALAHSDGMVMFADQNTLIVNQYDEPLRSAVLDELRQAFPGIEIVEIEAAWDDDSWDGNIGSACGINVNSVVTTNFIYVPHFGDQNSDVAIETISSNTNKTVVAVPAENVCKMGGSVRCLSWQVSGEQVEALLAKF